MVTHWVDAVNGAGFMVTSVAVGDLYTGGIVWATRLNQNPDSTLADALRFASSLAAAVPQGCSTAALAGIGSRISNVQATGVWPFYIRPGALLVVLVDTGPRPVPLASCPEASSFGATPAGWARFAGGPLDRYATRFAFATTNETESLDQLRARCLGVTGFPPGALDSLEPSAVKFFGPWAQMLVGMQVGLATGIDLCDALGAPGPSAFADMATKWYAYLAHR
ncbi:MAG: hypothetical protein E6J88_15110 [Deltaproteobacteria bacterium]|nr:MAG: hypothetical protein E6J88_15110 [Deltaproteobacteria bacterium]